MFQLVANHIKLDIWQLEFLYVVTFAIVKSHAMAMHVYKTNVSIEYKWQFSKYFGLVKLRDIIEICISSQLSSCGGSQNSGFGLGSHNGHFDFCSYCVLAKTKHLLMDGSLGLTWRFHRCAENMRTYRWKHGFVKFWHRPKCFDSSHSNPNGCPTCQNTFVDDVCSTCILVSTIVACGGTARPKVRVPAQ